MKKLLFPFLMFAASVCQGAFKTDYLTATASASIKGPMVVEGLMTTTTFYHTSSGTVQGQFNIISPPASGFGAVSERFFFTPRTSSFAPGSSLELRMIGNSGFNLRGMDNDGDEGTYLRLAPGVEPSVGGQVRFGVISPSVGEIPIFTYSDFGVEISTQTTITNRLTVSDKVTASSFTITQSDGLSLEFPSTNGNTGLGIDAFYGEDNVIIFINGIPKVEFAASQHTFSVPWYGNLNSGTALVVERNGFNDNTLYVNTSTGVVGISTTNVHSAGKLKVAGAGYFKNETDAFGTTSPYTALILDGGEDGAGYLVGRANPNHEPFLALSGYDSTALRGLYFGGGGWNVPDANEMYFYTAPTYTETNDTGVLRMYIAPAGDVQFSSSTNLMSTTSGQNQLRFRGTSTHFIDAPSANQIRTNVPNAGTVKISHALVESMSVSSITTIMHGKVLDGFKQKFKPGEAHLPTSSFCAHSNPAAAMTDYLLCDATTDENIQWNTILYPYKSTTLRVDAYATMATASSGYVVSDFSVMCASNTYAADLDTASFGTINSTTTAVPSVAGRPFLIQRDLNATDDGCIEGSHFILKYNRDANNASDTAAGDLELRMVHVYEP